MWLTLAFISAVLLGLYDTAKKEALKDNAVIPVLFFNTLFCSCIFIPFIVMSAMGVIHQGDLLYVPAADWSAHRYILLKSIIVLSSWLCGYFATKHLPLTIIGPVNATRPVMTLVGAMLIFGERLNTWQWAGVFLSVLSFYLLSLSGKREGIDFKKNHFIHLLIMAAILGAASGLYDKYLMTRYDNMLVQGWYNIYQCGLMLLVLGILWWPRRHETTPFHWSWSIVLISIFLSLADFSYLSALRYPDSMISITSMVRRSSVLVSFIAGAVLLHEKNLRSKAVDLLLVLLGMVCLYIGTR